MIKIELLCSKFEINPLYSEIDKAHISCRFTQKNIHSMFQHPTMCNISTHPFLKMKNSATSHKIMQA